MFKKIITFPLLVMAGLYIFIVEELIWNPAVYILDLARTSVFVLRFERWVAKRKGGWAVAILFILPGVSVWPVKFFAIYLLGHGHPLAGITTFIIVKVVATALFAQMYTLIGHECEKVVWFHWCAEKIRQVRSWVQSQKLYQAVREILSEVKAKIRSRKSIIKHRLLAVVRYIRSRRMNVRQ